MKHFFREPTNQVLLLTLFGALTFGLVTSPFREHSYVKKLQTERFWTLKARGYQTYDFVIVGDSRVYRGIDPDVISTLNPGMKGINLGFSSGGFGPLLFDLAEKRLSPAGQKIILIGLTPHAFTENAIANDHLKQYISKPLGESLSAAYLDPHFSFFSPVSFSNLFRLEPVLSSSDNYIEHYYDSGFVGSDYKKRAPETALASYSETWNKYKVRPEEERSLLARMITWKQNGFRVITFDLPVNEKLQQLEARESGYNAKWLETQLRQTNIPHFSPDPKDFESYDGSHLTEESANKLSSVLGIFIKNLSN